MKTSLIALGLMAALPFAASAADGLSYNYVEGGYVNTDTRGGDAGGWALKGSVAVHPNFHVFGEYMLQMYYLQMRKQETKPTWTNLIQNYWIFTVLMLMILSLFLMPDKSCSANLI